jgi:hypothetical protein
MDALFELFAPLIGHWRVMIATLAALLVAVVLTILLLHLPATTASG